MKKILGSLLIFINLFAASFEVEVSKQNPYIKEPVILDLKYFDKNQDEIVWIKFEPIKSSAYKTIFLGKKNREFGYEFTYLLFPLNSGKIEVSYALKVKKAPLEEIHNKITGTGYEQTKPIEGTVYNYNVNPTILNVKSAKRVDLYGSFNLESKIDKTKADEYEPIYWTLNLKGVGYPPQIDSILNEIKGVKVLKDKPLKNIKYTKKGAEVDYTFNFAFVSNKSFTIPSVKFSEFNYKEYKLLETQPIKIEIKKAHIKADKMDEPKKIEPFFNHFISIFKYLSIFFAGALSGILLYLLFRKEDIEKIVKARDEKELLTFLIVKYPNCLEDIKDRLDNAISKREDINLFKIKKEIVKRVKKDCK